MYLADYHTHSATSPDGQLTVSELAEAAVRAGLDEICVTDHVDTVLWGDHRPREHFDWSRLLRELPEARETYTGRSWARRPWALTGRRNCWARRQSWTLL